jgi:hypothetical protein
VAFLTQKLYYLKVAICVCLISDALEMKSRASWVGSPNHFQTGATLANALRQILREYLILI